MNGNFLEERSALFGAKLQQVKKDIDASFPWYPYGTLNNFSALRPIFNDFPLDQLVGQTRKTLDIGAADGELAFFLETLGYGVDIIDYPPTNYNHLRGARLLKDRLNSRMEIYERDLDSQFPTLTEKYGLVFFLGILYHLKNPFYVLEQLSRISGYLIVSTRIARFTPDGTQISAYPLAYLLAPDESNNDSTNYWIFSQKGLERIVERTGWTMQKLITLGDVVHSNPSAQDRDERAFALLKSRNFG